MPKRQKLKIEITFCPQCGSHAIDHSDYKNGRHDVNCKLCLYRGTIQDDDDVFVEWDRC